MKMTCRTCGVHFQEDFEKTLTDKCDFWGASVGNLLSKLPEKYKKLIWDWMFSLPIDEISENTGIEISPSIDSRPYLGNIYERFVPGYAEWPEDKKKKFQAEYSKFHKEMSEAEYYKLLLEYFVQSREVSS